MKNLAAIYLPRDIDPELLKWKNDKHHKPLLIRGARQVGKSSAVRQLAKSFRFFAEINFEKDERLKRIFDGELSPKRICNELSAITSVPVIPGDTLVFLDEIQGCEAAINSLRFFYEDYPELHIIAAGSLLEFALKDLSSFGVGRIRSLYMYPFSFNEFLNALGFGVLLEAKKHASVHQPLSESLHLKLVEQIRYFQLIGGMPAAVNLWKETNNYNKCKAIHNDIIQTYLDDFSKYHKRIDPNLLRNTMNAVAANTCSKFKYSSVGNEYDTRQVKQATDMLSMAGLIKPVTHTSANAIPLGAEANDKFRKYIFIDPALLLRLLHLEVEDILISLPSDFVNKGKIAEMFVGLELTKYSSPYEKSELYYWQREEKSAQAEVDYIIARNGKIIPVEVKAGRRGSLQSMYIFLEKKALNSGIRCALEPFSSYNNILVYPLYAVSNFTQTT
ncbi:MAG: AAA family ATPase [Bacteroidales bacterium]|jgi:predicted AAA+ superfamily ATPase|nr:AAA family ATPase [Bacteroidales bacterium]